MVACSSRWLALRHVLAGGVLADGVLAGGPVPVPVTVSDLDFLFDRPAEPIFLPKANALGRQVLFDVPATYLVSPAWSGLACATLNVNVNVETVVKFNQARSGKGG